jgi:hypothetical protein
MTNAERLTRFPGPLRLYPPRLRYLLGVPVGLFFLALSLTYEHKGGFWGGILLSSFAIVASAASATPQMNSLTLRDDGFDVRFNFRRVTVPWREARDFMVVGQDSNAYIMFRNDGLSSIGMSEYGGRNAALTRTYGMPAEELAALMQQWRERAMAAHGSRQTNADPAQYAG